jgi:hypothetical protein
MTPIELDRARMTAGFALWRTWDLFDLTLTDPEYALALCHLNSTIRTSVLSMARSGQELPHKSLCAMAAILTDLGNPLPAWLQEYLVAVVNRKATVRSRGRNPVANIVRDVAISRAVACVSDGYGLPPTRNAATKSACGCSIVAEALAAYCNLHMTEANVTAIWRRGGAAERDQPDALDWEHRNTRISFLSPMTTTGTVS